MNIHCVGRCYTDLKHSLSSSLQLKEMCLELAANLLLVNGGSAGSRATKKKSSGDEEKGEGDGWPFFE